MLDLVIKYSPRPFVFWALAGLRFAFLKNESGATAIEYGLIAAGISVVIIGALTIVGTQLQATFTTTDLTTANAAAGG